MAELLRQRIVYQGRVQGVGFRYTTASIARRYPVVGFVKNLPDGTVELVAEAESTILTNFLENISSEFAGHIHKQESREIPRDQALKSFEIRR